MKRLRYLIAVLILALMIGGTAGCNGDLQSLFQKSRSPEAPLIKVQIQFSDQKLVVCYVKTLGLEKGAPVFTGGSSSNNMYDKDGNVVGSFNYSHVLYMTVMPEEGGTD